MTWVVVGASAGLGRALAERLARDGRALLLVARDERDLAPLANDLTASGAFNVRFLAQDAADLRALTERLYALLAVEEVEGLLFAIGATDERDDGLSDASVAEHLLRVNFLSVVSVVSRFLPKLVAQHRGVVIGFGSVAAARGRSRNVVYSAAKRALESYFESLRHLTEREGLTIAFYTLGYLDTGQAFGKRLLLPAASPHAVADRVCRNLYSARGKRHLPRWWAPLVAGIRFTPWWVFKRMKF